MGFSARNNTAYVVVFVYVNRPGITLCAGKDFPYEGAHSDAAACLACTMITPLYHDMIPAAHTASVKGALCYHRGAAHCVVTKAFELFLRGMHRQLTPDHHAKAIGFSFCAW
jgi:hypothetical protein